MDKLNAREELVAAANWLAYQDESLSFGLKNAEDAVKLWRYWHSAATENLPEFCDESGSDAETDEILRHVEKAVGYNPWANKATAP